MEFGFEQLKYLHQDIKRKVNLMSDPRRGGNPLTFRPSTTIFVSQEAWDHLRKLQEDSVTRPVMHPSRFLGVNIQRSDFLPIPKRRLRSLDRFAEYDSHDADWAVAAGLAEWVDESVHALAIDRNGHRAAQELAEIMQGFSR